MTPTARFEWRVGVVCCCCRCCAGRQVFTVTFRGDGDDEPCHTVCAEGGEIRCVPVLEDAPQSLRALGHTRCLNLEA